MMIDQQTWKRLHAAHWAASAADAAHDELLSKHAEPLARERWAHLTSGTSEPVTVVIAGRLTTDGVDRARVVSRERVRSILADVRPEAFGARDACEALQPFLDAPRLGGLVITANEHGLADALAYDGPPPLRARVTGPGGDA